MKKIQKSEEEWRKELSPEQYRILRQKGTETAFSGEYNDHFEEGLYMCSGCGNKLFLSTSKFESGCGWPSFDRTASKDEVEEKPDTSYGMTRTEILCSKCGGHLGHVFNDGPTDTGLRYCVNSASIKFEKPSDKG